MKLFFDTSALVKFFHEETGTELVTQLINNPQNEVWISELTIVELCGKQYANCTQIFSQLKIHILYPTNSMPLDTP